MMNEFGGAFGAFGGIFGALISLLILVAGIAALFVPFWVLRIRNELIETNKKLDELVRLGRDNKSVS